MKKYALVMLAALALVGCNDEEAKLRIEMLERKNVRLEEQIKKLRSEAQHTMDEPSVSPRSARDIDPGVGGTPKYYTAHGLLDDQVSDGIWLSLGMKTALSVPANARTPELIEFIRVYRTRVEIYRAARESIEKFVPPVMADPNTHPKRLEMMKSQIESINKNTAEIERLVAELPAESATEN